MTKYILWDNDGVLVETEYWYFKASQRALAELDIEMSESQYMIFMTQGRSCFELASEAGIDEVTLDKKRIERNAYYQAFIRSQDIEIPGVVDVLRALSQTCKMAVVTSCRRDDFNLIHQDGNILAFMDLVLVREDYTHSKPHPEPYLLALEKLGANAADTIVVEDSQRGLRSAIAAGIDCAVVYNKFTESHDFSGATHRLSSLEALAGLLD